MKCKNCLKWQGTRYSKWSDCHYIAFHVLPELKHMVKYSGFHFTPPFDPHDFKYAEGGKIPKKIKSLPDGVRVQYVSEPDVWYNDNGEERIRNVKLPHLQTRSDFVCPFDS